MSLAAVSVRNPFPALPSAWEHGRTDVELYEALKQPLGAEAARMIAERLPGEEVATKPHLDQRFETFGAQIRADMAEMETRLSKQMADVINGQNNRMWVMFAPMWIGVFLLVAEQFIRG